MDPLFYFALFVLLILVATGLGVVVWLAMLPGKVAADRGHPQAKAIQIAGWLGLVTVVFWGVALVWAYTEPQGVDQSDEISELKEEIGRLEARLEAGEEAAS